MTFTQCYDSKLRNRKYDVTVEVNKVEESPAIENDARQHNNSNEVRLKSQNDNPPSEKEIKGQSSTTTAPIEINKEDVIHVTKSSSLRDFISLSLSVGAEV